MTLTRELILRCKQSQLYWAQNCLEINTVTVIPHKQYENACTYLSHTTYQDMKNCFLLDAAIREAAGVNGAFKIM